jgi:DMSO/TMAO reductase YedYZ molybdopterin-dependent catalytic subunit
MRGRILSLSLLVIVIIASPAWAGAPQEIREYQGQKLSPFERDYDNAIEQPLERQVKIRSYRLKVEGLVNKPLSLTYDQVLALPHVKRMVNMPCVEGWTETLLYEGVRLADLFTKAKMKPGVTTVIFHTVGKRYSSSLSLAYVKKADVLLGFKINGLKLNQERGFPFQVVAPHKLGYKWVKWVERIELSDKPYKGFWEKYGYSNQADLGRRSR